MTTLDAPAVTMALLAGSAWSTPCRTEMIPDTADGLAIYRCTCWRRNHTVSQTSADRAAWTCFHTRVPGVGRYDDVPPLARAAEFALRVRWAHIIPVDGRAVVPFLLYT